MTKFIFLLEYNEYIRDKVNNIESKYSDEYINQSISSISRGGKLILKEGLIYSQPQKTTVDILKRRFTELDTQIYDGGDISIMGMYNKLSKYIPLINNLGYFISSAFIGNDNISFTEKTIGDIKVDEIFIEPKYDYQVDIPKVLYHASPLKFKEKILKSGLSPRSGNKLSNHPDRIYLTDSYNKCIRFGEYLVMNDRESEYYKNGYCIYEISGDSINNLYSDINFREGGFYTLDNISPNRIKLLKEIRKDDL